jgi:protein ImuB
MKSYAVLLAPEFRLQATLRHAPEWAGKPVALLESGATRPQVAELNAAARAQRVERGMTPTQALARCADLHLVSGNPGHERSARETMLQIAETFSPFLEATAPGVVTVELPAERSVDEAALRARGVDPLLALGLEIQLGVAATPDLALLAARFARPVRFVEDAATFLHRLPVEALEPSPEILSVLESWGIRSIGALNALPFAEVGERLGPEALRLWERSHGGRARPLRLVKPREFFAEQADLENAVEMLEPLLFLLRRFLDQIAARLAAVYLVAGKLRLVLRFETGESYSRTFTLPQPTRDVDLLFRLLHTHLENFTSPSPIVGLELAARPVRPGAEQHGLLEKSLRDPHRLAETLARLQALLGPDRVGSPAIEPSHHPDAFRLRPYRLADAAAPGPDEQLLLGIPCLRFRPPVRARVTLEDHQPAFLDCACCRGPIEEARGPWLLEGDWWSPQPWAREEWDVAVERGFYRLVRVGEDWFLDGIYA